MHHEHDFLPLLLIMALAFLVPVVAGRLRLVRLPSVALEILLGIVIGRSGLELIESDKVLDFLSLFGFAYLMFLSGLEIDFTKITAGISGKKGGDDLLRILVMFTLTVLMSAGIAWVVVLLGLGSAGSFPLLTLILCTTAVGVVLPTLRDENQARQRLGQIILLAAVLADIIAIMALSAILILMTRGVTWDLVAVILAGLILLFSVRFGHFVSARDFTGVLGRFLNRLARPGNQIRVRGALLLMVAFVALAQSLGQEMVLGAFMAGALVSLFTPRDSGLFFPKLEAVGFGFFIPIFFIMVGVRFDASVLTGGWHTFILLGTLIVGAYSVTIVPAIMVFSRPLGLRRALAVGTLLSTRLSMIIAISTVGLKMGLITDEFNSAVILLALASCFISPSLFVKLVHNPVQRSLRVIVGGAGRVGRDLVRRLVDVNVSVVVVESDPPQLDKLTVPVPTIVGDVGEEATLQRLDLGPEDVFVAVTGNDETNLRACQIALRIGEVKKTVARDSNPDNTERFARLGVIPMDRTGSLALAIENLILRPSLVQLLGSESTAREAFEVRVDHLPDKVRYIRDFGHLRDTLVILVRRGDDLIVPHGDTELMVEDVIVALGSEDDRNELKELMEKNTASFDGR